MMEAHTPVGSQREEGGSLVVTAYALASFPGHKMWPGNEARLWLWPHSQTFHVARE